MKTTLATTAIKTLRFSTGLVLSAFLILPQITATQAAILFQDDDFHDIVSDGIIIDSDGAGGSNTTLQFGNDTTASQNGSILWDITADEFVIDNDINLGGVFDGADTTQFTIRQVDFGGIFVDPGAPTCTVDGELAVDIGPAAENIYICTDNATNEWTLVSTAAGDFLSAIASDTYGDAAGAQTLTIGDGTNADALTAAANSLIDFSASNQFVMRTEAVDPGTCTEGELYYNTTNNELRVCTATDTWSTSGPQDFEDVYGVDADNTLTASGTFDIDATGAVGIDSDAGLTFGGAGIGITSDGGALSLTGDGTNDIDLLNAGAALDFDSATFDVLTTAGFSIDGGAASNVTTAAGDLTLSATAGSSIVSGGEAVADAVQITATNAAGGVDINAGTGGVAVDSTGAVSVDAVGASNFTTDSGALTISTTTSGDLNLTGAGDIVFDDGTITGIITLSDSDTDWAATFSDNGIVDVINSFTSTANGEGASNIGIEDAGSYFTATDVEGALQELAGKNNDVLTFFPEYPDTVIFQDGSANKGKLEALYDGTNGNYYQWTSKQGALNDIDLRFRFEMPTDYLTTGDFTIDYQTGTAVVGENRFDVTLQNVTDTATCATSTSNVNVAWTTITLAAATIDGGCTLDPGDLMEVQIKLYSDNTTGAFSRAGEIIFDYNP